MARTHLWQADVFDMAVESDRIRLEGLRLSNASLEVHDTLDSQVAEWAICRNPLAKQDPSIMASTLTGLMEGEDWEAFGTWVHYPWSNRLVRLLPEEAFIEVRTNRNRNKISAEETAALRQKTVGVVGLSVGQATAIALAMERGCGRLKLADFDVVELSNMNRIRCGLHELDLPKWVVAARTIAEFDPFVEVEPFDEGLSAETMDAFLEDCDVVIDACDSLGMKAQLRMACKSRQLPVVMDTNDRGMIDVERYDVPALCGDGYLHGRIGEDDMRAFAEMTGWTPEALQAFVDIEQASERGRASLGQVGQTLVSWPQTYTGVAAGGAHAAEVCRRLLLGEDLPDARIYMDLNEQLTHAPLR